MHPLRTSPGRETGNHAIASWASFLRLHFALLRHPRVGFLYARVIKNIMVTYFVPQFIPGRVRRVVRLDMELDRLVPFDPSSFPRYMEFTRFWIGSLGWIYGRFGHAALGEIRDFLTGLESLFFAANEVFSVCGSTLSRPGPKLSFDSLLIHLADRNRYCFPSLHVMIVCFTDHRVAQMLDRLNAHDEEAEHARIYHREQAKRIVESTVQTKQHSLCDIPSALFLLDSLDVGYGTSRNLDFLAGLFAGGSAEQARRIPAFLTSMYSELDQRTDSGKAAAQVLLDFLGSYQGRVKGLLANEKPLGMLPVTAGCTGSPTRRRAYEFASSGKGYEFT